MCLCVHCVYMCASACECTAYTLYYLPALWCLEFPFHTINQESLSLGKYKVYLTLASRHSYKNIIASGLASLGYLGLQTSFTGYYREKNGREGREETATSQAHSHTSPVISWQSWTSSWCLYLVHLRPVHLHIRSCFKCIPPVEGCDNTIR